MELKPFPKIFTLGDPRVNDILDDEVEITEKVDGSQISWGKFNGELRIRSKGREIFPEAADKIFQPAVSYIVSISDKIPDGLVFYGETLAKPKHNILAYDRVPKNNIVLFGISNNGLFLQDFGDWPKLLDLERVPILYVGKCKPQDAIDFTKNTISYLGGPLIEGVVIKNYNKELIFKNWHLPLMSAKYVRESFKEKNNTEWRKEHTSKGRLEIYCLSFKNENRWCKAIQHLRESGELELSPRDIGKLLVEIKRDIKDEEQENIKSTLYDIFESQIMRTAISGFPEFYKKWLIENMKSQ